MGMMQFAPSARILVGSPPSLQQTQLCRTAETQQSWWVLHVSHQRESCVRLQVPSSWPEAEGAQPPGSQMLNHSFVSLAVCMDFRARALLEVPAAPCFTA